MDNYNQPGYGYNQSLRSGLDDNPANETIYVSMNARRTLLSISKWAKFLAIFSIVMFGFLILFGLLLFGGVAELSSTFAGDIGNATILRMVGVFYAIIAAVFMYPSIKMLNYANYMKKAVTSNNERYYEQALGNINFTLKFYGILAIISLVPWALGIIGFLLGSLLV